MPEDKRKKFVEVKKEEINQNFEIKASEYWRIYRTSSAEQNFQCKCSKNHESLEQLLKHIQDNHLEVRGPNCCTVCQKIFRDPRDLTRHTDYVHKKIKTDECPICKKKFAYSHLTNRHLKQVHEKIKNFNCHLCGKQFPQAQNLGWHIMGVHEKLKPYKCDTCGNYFAQVSSLSIHKKNIHQRKK